ncbi:MAG: hypothetical protein HA496_07765 [Thaumarchaeota archaeon]|jgi:tRNA threonylcarbamoyladenosine modification (KEOPS) complex  Pcc1 subunit|nr:hypothetical protein [Nitrososphaerota archaeon]
MIRVRITLKYGSQQAAESIYLACLQEAVSDPRSGVGARIDGNRLLLFFKGHSPSKTAEKIGSVLSLLNMAQQVDSLLSTPEG